MGHGKEYIIGSFHVTDLSRSTSTRYRAQQIADLILHEGMDLVALQGIRDSDALTPILTCLGKSWNRSWLLSRPKKGIRDVDHDPRGEGYAFLWDTRRFRLLQSTLLNGDKKDAEPEICSKYRSGRDKGLETLPRDPVFGRFTASGLGGGNFELRLICTRILYNGIDEDHDRRFWPLRQNEFDVLTRQILPQIEDTVYGNQMPAYTILLGDYNMNLMCQWTKKPYIDTPAAGFREGDKQIITVQDQLTTLKKPKKAGETTVGYLHNYDHFSYNRNRLSALDPVSRRIDVVGNGYYSTYYGNYDRYREEISGHLPIVLVLRP